MDVRELWEIGENVPPVSGVYPAELTFPFNKDAVFVDMETKKEVSSHGRALRADYLKRLEGFISKLRTACSESRIDYLLVNTGDPFEDVLFRYLAGRKRRGG